MERVFLSESKVLSARKLTLLKDKKTASEMPAFFDLVTPIFECANKAFAMWEKDNKNIYYERVPPEGECQPPAPAFLSKVTPYQEPYAVPPQISFQQAGCCVM